MIAFDQMAALPELRRLFDLAWRAFGVNPALVSPDGQRSTIFDFEERSQPFCRALHRIPGANELCAMCDRSKFLEARRRGQELRYRCHAGLTEFVIPVLRDGQVMALLQCGQVHDHVPTAEAWREVSQSLLQAGVKTSQLRRLFWRNNVLSPDRQKDLLDLLALIAARLAHCDERAPLPPGQTQAALGRAMTYIETHLSERLTVTAIARAANLSSRSLMRLFREQAGSSIVEHILRRRIVRARRLLGDPHRTCAEVAFACGFGSVQHFNRIFRRLEGTSPTGWRAQLPQP